MGLFDKIFGRQAEESMKQPNAQQQFDTLRQKYATVLAVADQQGVQLTDLHLQESRLYVKGVAPTSEAMHKVWDQIKLVDPAYADLALDLTVAEQKEKKQNDQTYAVQPGDNLSKISKRFYGNPNEYMRIFYANRQTINDPDMIKVGQVLSIPAEESTAAS